MQIYDNFLSEEEFGLIRGYFINGNFPWYYAPFANNTNDPEHYYQLSHVIYWSNLGKVSNAFDTIKPLVNKINPEILIKIKANFNPRSDGSKVCEYHIDTDFNFNTKTAIYYINTKNLKNNNTEQHTLYSSIKNINQSINDVETVLYNFCYIIKFFF